jgi:hypothetical protein
MTYCGLLPAPMLFILWLLFGVLLKGFCKKISVNYSSERTKIPNVDFANFVV